MEVKKTSVVRLRVFAAVLALGLIAWAFGSRSPLASSPISPSSEQRNNSGSASGEQPQALPENSLPVNVGHAVFTSPPNETQLQTAWKQSTVRLKYLDHCATESVCTGFDNSEASSYDLDVRRQTAREIDDFVQISETWMAAQGGDLPQEAQTIAQYFLKTGNDDVKEAALKLIDLAKPSSDNLRAALNAVQNSSSGPLVKDLAQTDLIKSCAERELASMCVSFVRNRSLKGGEGVQKALARNSGAFMNEFTLAAFVAWENAESPRSQKRYFIEVTRVDFLRGQRGG